MKRISDNFILGVLIVIVGIIFGGNNLGIWDIEVFFNGWWTLFLIIPAINSILRKGFETGNVILLGIGVLLLLNEWDIAFVARIKGLIFPIILVCIGVSIMSSNKKVKKKKIDNSYDFNEFPEYSAFFGGGDHINNSKNLKGLTATAIFGGLKIDLRGANITEDISIDVTSIFGGVDILVPEEVEVVEGSGVPVFGGFSNNVKNREVKGLHKVTVNHLTIFGGTEIK